MVVEFASRLLSESYNYMKCAHRDDGYKMCAKAEHAKKYGELKLSYEGKYHYQKSFWCPKPEEDPNLVCQVLKWYFAINRQHEMEFIAWDKLQNFAGGRYNLTWPVLFQESWENYERFRNNFTVPLDDLFFANGGFGSGFFLPTCVNEHVQFADYNTMLTVHHTRWNFPGMCGDYRANETAAFMELMGAGPESDVHTRSEPKEFWRDRIPRVRPFPHSSLSCLSSQFPKIPILIHTP
jgi:hypothetical protein